MCYSLHCCLAVFLVAFVAIDACIVYTAVVRIDSQTQMGGMSVLPYGHNASVPMMAGHPELNYIDLSTAGFELICLLVLCFAVAWDQLGLLRLGMCGFSVAIIVETVALVGLMVLVMILAIDRGLGFFGWLILFVLVTGPSIILLVFRCVGLLRLQTLKLRLAASPLPFDASASASSRAAGERAGLVASQRESYHKTTSYVRG